MSRSPERITWSWHGEAPSTDGDFGLCLYDGEGTAQTEAAAPDTDSLILSVSASSIEADDEALSAEVVAEDSWLERIFGGGGIGLTALDSVDGNRIISPLQDGRDLCFGKSISIAYANGPPFPKSGNQVMDAEEGKRLLDELAAEHNAGQGARALSAPAAGGGARQSAGVCSRNPLALTTLCAPCSRQDGPESAV